MRRFRAVSWYESWPNWLWVLGSLALPISGCCEDDCRPHEAPSQIINRTFCNGDSVMLEEQCFDDGDYVGGTHKTFQRDCAAIGAQCFSGACVMRDEVCPADHDSYCDVSGVRKCVGDRVAIEASACDAEQHCMEITESGKTRAQCVVSETPCSREFQQCDDNTLITCEQGFPVAQRVCAASVASICVEFAMSDGAACRSPACEADFFGWLCQEGQVITCAASDSEVLADCNERNEQCTQRDDHAFCSTTGVLAQPTWRQIPTGSFTFVKQSAESVVALPSFEMLATEVTVAQYWACVDDGACYSDGTTPSRSTGGNTPVTGLPWDAPEDFCTWIGGRLPSEIEWQYVATNQGTTRFPWGNAPASCELAVLGASEENADPNCGHGATESCSLAGDQTQLGVCDLMGNVSELVTSPESAGQQYQMGGNFESPAEALSLVMPVAERGTWDWLSETVGFRCVREDA